MNIVMIAHSDFDLKYILALPDGKRKHVMDKKYTIAVA